VRSLILIAALAALSACGGQSSQATFTCPNGPDLSVAYTKDGATLYFPDGRVELLPRPDPERPNLYAKPGFRWAVGTREARLDDGSKSYACDQMAG
jgi:hypothetical protein